MARQLRLEIEGDAKDARKALDEAADAADKAARSTDKLGGQFRETTRTASRLDVQLAETRRELKKLNEEYERGGDPKVLKQIQQQYTEYDRIAKLKRRIHKEDEDARKEFDKAAAAAKAMSLRDVMGGDQRGAFRRTLGGLGGLGGSALQSGLGATARIPGGAIAGTLLGVSAAPAAGALGGAALLGGAGLGAVGAGIAGAVANNPEPFRRAWQDAIQDISKRWQSASAGFERPALSAFATLRNALDDINIEQPLKDAQKYVEPLARGISGLVTGFGNGIGKLVSKAGPIIDVLAQRLPELGKAFDTAFSRIGDSSDGAAQALSDILKVVRTGIIAVGGFIGTLSDVYGKTVEIRRGVSGLLGIDVFGDQDTMLQTYGRRLDTTKQSTFDMATAQKEMADAAKAASDEFDRQTNLMLGLEGAQDNAYVALQKLKEGFKEHGYALQGNSDAALENRDNLRQVIQAYEDVRVKAIESSDGSQGAIREANQAYLAHLEELRGILKAHGQNTEAIDKYIEDFKRMNGLTATQYIKIRYDVASRPAGLPANLGTRYGGTDNHAAGGTVKSTGFKLVGEQGPEIVWGDKGQFVSTAAQTKQLMSAWSTMANGGGGGGAPTALTVGVAPGSDSAVAALVQRLMQQDLLQFFVNGQPVTARRT